MGRTQGVVLLQCALSRDSGFAAPSDIAINDAPSPERVFAQPPLPSAAAVTVECVAGDRLAMIDSEWGDLVGRADAANVFMHPELIRIAAQSYGGDRCRTLLAWQVSGNQRRLVGVWAFAVRRTPQSCLPMQVLAAPACPHAYLATPVVDRDALEPTLRAMLDHIADNPTLPKLVTLDGLQADGATVEALFRLLAARQGSWCILSRSARPKLASELDGKRYLEQALSSATRKKLRQHRRRLSEKGALEFGIVSERGAVQQAFERFLKLEASGWKGRHGTALLSNDADAHFARGMVGALAEHGEASIHTLCLDGEPVSMQVVLRAGAAAFTWKTAYDENRHDASPGMLLLEDYTAAFLADESIAFVDSCAHDDSGFMGAWRERQPVMRLWIDARSGRSVSFSILCQLQRAYLGARETVKTIYLARPRRRARRRGGSGLAGES